MVLLLAFMAAAAVQTPPPSTPEPDTVVVTASVAQLKAAWEKCRVGGCTPREDIVATIRYAEVVFRGGRYADARHVLQEAIARDKGAAKAEPLAVAALYEATATVARHDGEQDVVRSAAYARVRVLRDNLPNAGTALFQAELDAGDVDLRYGELQSARGRYAMLARRAHSREEAALVGMRVAVVEHALRDEHAADEALARITGASALSSPYKVAAQATAARFARENGDKAATDRLVAAFLSSDQPGPPVLVWQPPIAAPITPGQDSYSRINHGPAVQIGAAWADIGFTILADGTVDSPEILRGTRDSSWSRPIVAVIAARRYTPRPQNAAPLYRIERWTLTADYVVGVQSNIKLRAGTQRYAQLDLTPDDPVSEQVSR
jgi:hypothetical protein